VCTYGRGREKEEWGSGGGGASSPPSPQLLPLLLSSSIQLESRSPMEPDGRVSADTTRGSVFADSRVPVGHRPTDGRASADTVQDGRASTDSVQEGRVSADSLQDGRASTDMTQDGRASADMTQEDSASTDMTQDGRGSTDMTQDGRASTDMTQEDSASTDMTQDGRASADMTQDGHVSEDMTQEDSASTDMTQDGRASADSEQEGRGSANRAPDGGGSADGRDSADSVQDVRIAADRTQDACASVDRPQAGCPSGYRTQEGRASVSRTRSVPMAAWCFRVGDEESSPAGVEEVPRGEGLSRVEGKALAKAEAKGSPLFEGSYWNDEAGGYAYSLRQQQSEQPNAGEHDSSPPMNGQSASGNAQSISGPSDREARAVLSDFAANRDVPYKLFSPLQPVPSRPDQLWAETADSWIRPADSVSMAGSSGLCELDSSLKLMAVNSMEGIPAVKRRVDYGEALQRGCSREERPDRRRKSSLAKTTSLPPETRRPRVQFTHAEGGFASTKST
jgi:hypothetical protein